MITKYCIWNSNKPQICYYCGRIIYTNTCETCQIIYVKEDEYNQYPDMFKGLKRVSSKGKFFDYECNKSSVEKQEHKAKEKTHKNTKVSIREKPISKGYYSTLSLKEYNHPYKYYSVLKDLEIISCPFCNKALTLSKYHNKLCVSCDIEFISNEYYNLNKLKYIKCIPKSVILKMMRDEAKSKPKPIPRREIQLSDIVVKVSHKEMKEVEPYVEPVKGILRVGKNHVIINMYYHRRKNIYFSYASEFEFKDIPYCKILTYKDYMKKKSIGNDLNPQSILYCYGYWLTGKTVEQRIMALRFVIDNNILDWKAIVAHLEFLISLRQNDVKKNCVREWNRDIEWVRNYANSTQEWIYISPVQ